MKIHPLIYILIAFSFLFTGCFSNDDECDPSRFCESTPIDSNWVNIDLTEQSTGVPIVLYNDNLEDNNVILRDTLYTSSISYYLPMEVVYTAEAYYRSGPNTIIAVDSRRLDQETFQNCGQMCYENNEITLDLVLID